jgi:hypothetical protein
MATSISIAVAMAISHANLMIPPPRNANDMVLPEFAHGRSPAVPCTCANGPGGGTRGERNGCDLGVKRNSGGGQPCLWWSQGCSIGCEFCETDPRHPANGGKIPTKAITGNPPHADKAGFRRSYCNHTNAAPWTLPREAWSMNLHAVEGAVNDSYRFNPWRAPGTAPVVDPCGQAGGKFKQTPMGGASVYTDTALAKMGDMGSVVLPPVKDELQPTWTAGTAVDVAWGMRYNHGGGYQYRLCPTGRLHEGEACFMETPLDFDKAAHTLLWNNGSVLAVLGEEKGVFVSGDGVVTPAGSTWARNPIPRVNTDNIGLAVVGNCIDGDSGGRNGGGRNKPSCQQFEALCPQDTGTFPFCADVNDSWPCSYDGSGMGACSGDWTAGLIADKVVIPKNLKPGNYVLGWRYDCEETAQVWQSCADVKIVS